MEGLCYFVILATIVICLFLIIRNQSEDDLYDDHEEWEKDWLEEQKAINNEERR